MRRMFLCVALTILGCESECHDSVAIIGVTPFFCHEHKKLEVIGNVAYCKCPAPKAEAEAGAK